jgi:hypothetical protein
MAAYRLYFLDAKGAIQARQDFAAEDDREAMTIAGLLWQACVDCYEGYELWQRTRRVARARVDSNPASPPAIDHIGREMRQRLLELQEALLSSHWRAAHSAALRAATEALRRRLAGSGTPGITPDDLMRYIGAKVRAEMMSLQLTEGSRLMLRGSRGFDRFFDDYFAIVDCDDCACGVAFKRARQTVVPTIDASPIYAGQRSLGVLRAQGVVSCVSTPFLGGDGAIAGMFSILRPDIWHPADGELAQLRHIANDITAAIADPLSAEARHLHAGV